MIESVVDLVEDGGELWQARRRQVGPDRVADGVEQRRAAPTAGCRPSVTASRSATMTCCWRSARVKSLSPFALRDREKARAFRAVEMVAPGGDRPAAALEPVAVVRRVREALDDVDVDAADGIDHPDEAPELELGVVLDVDPEQGAHRVLERCHAAIGELVGIGRRRTT